MSEATPSKWYESPLAKHIAGIALAIVLGLLASRFGITPQPLPDLIPLRQEIQQLKQELRYELQAIKEKK